MSDMDIDTTQNENQQSEFFVAAKRFRDMGITDKDWTSRELGLMVDAINMVRNNGWRLPAQIQADLEIRLFKMYKHIADSIFGFQDTFMPVLREQIERTLISEGWEKQQPKPNTEWRNIPGQDQDKNC